MQSWKLILLLITSSSNSRSKLGSIPGLPPTPLICGMNLAERRAIFSRKWETVLAAREVPRSGSFLAKYISITEGYHPIQPIWVTKHVDFILQTIKLTNNVYLEVNYQEALYLNEWRNLLSIAVTLTLHKSLEPRLLARPRHPPTTPRGC